MRQICLDTETTGFDPAKGDRIAEIACVELHNYLPTGKVFHKYINPNRPMPKAAFDVHGLSDEFLKDKPFFKEIAQEFLDFIQDSPLIIHNASFDIKFLNAELHMIKKKTLEKNEIIDTLQIARRKYPGSPATLDALCKRFNISLNNRTKHGALIGTELLAEVYLNLCEGRAPSLKLEIEMTQTTTVEYMTSVQHTRKAPLKTRLSADETREHQEFLAKFKQKTLWPE